MFAGLCDNCMHVQMVKSAKGSTFYLCMFSKINPSFSKYPRVPVLACSGYKPNDDQDETSSLNSDVPHEQQLGDE
jgi:hypothetical protein